MVTLRLCMQVNLYGALTMKEERQLQAEIAAAAQAPTYSAATEQSLLAEVQSNSYAKALLLIEMAAWRSSSDEQHQLLYDAAAAVAQCEQLEASLFAAAQRTTAKGKHSARPAPPVILSRSHDSVTLTHAPFALKPGVKAATFAVFCKSFGAGVSLSMNRTAAEYAGSGVPVATGERVTIQGLQPNGTYVFAIAAYDATGKVIGELGVYQSVCANAGDVVMLCTASHVLVACLLLG